MSTSRTASRWSPCSSMTPSLTEPPTPQRFLSRPASSRRPASSSGTFATVVTALPRRPLVSRRTLTRSSAAAAARARAFEGSGALRRSPSVLDQTTFEEPRLAIDAARRLAHADEVDHEHERLVGADDAARAALAVGQVRRDRDL